LWVLFSENMGRAAFIKIINIKHTILLDEQYHQKALNCGDASGSRYFPSSYGNRFLNGYCR
jgi:hypothetical protein